MQAVRVLRERNGLPESEHLVHVAVYRDGSLIATAGDAEIRAFLRSAAKPIQALAAILSGAVDQFEMTDPELALACGSHSGERRHTEGAAAVLERIGLGPTDLRCGAHAPVHEGSAQQLIRDEASASALHNNCSGKHAAMLAACVAAGWDTAGYLAPDHPLQRLNRANVAAFAGLESDALGVGTDGCSVPTFHTSLAAAARAFASLVRPDLAGIDGPLADAARRVTRAMSSAPEMVGGTGRADTLLMNSARGRLLSKVGAEGLWCVADATTGTGIALKCADGDGAQARRVGIELLRAAGALDDAGWDRLAPHRETVRRNHRQVEVGATHVELPTELVAACREPA